MFLLSNLAIPEVLNGNMTSEQVFSLFRDNNIFNLELGLCNKGEFNINMSEKTMNVIKENASFLKGNKGIVKNQLCGIKVLGNGTLEKKLTVRANRFSSSAVTKIESAGGVAEVI
jgi:ribosomal protein L15